MEKVEIVENIELGNYKIERSSKCGCDIVWKIVEDQLVYDIDHYDCGVELTLTVDGKPIFSSSEIFGVRKLAGIWFGELENEEVVRDDLAISDRDVNEEHEYNVRESLIDYLMQGDYELDRDDMRVISNEYIMILRECDTKQEISREEAESWAYDYLYEGGSSTRDYGAFRLEA